MAHSFFGSDDEFSSPDQSVGDSFPDDSNNSLDLNQSTTDNLDLTATISDDFTTTDTPTFATTSVDSVTIITTSDILSSTTEPTPILVSTTTSASQVSAVPTIAEASASPSSDATSSKKSGASSAAIGVTVTLLILALCAAAFFFIRRKHINDRNKRRSTWNRGFDQENGFVPKEFHDDVESVKRSDEAGDQFENIDINEKQGARSLPEHVTYSNLPTPEVPHITLPLRLHAGAYAPPRVPSPPPVLSTAASPDAPPAQLISVTPFAAAIAASRGSLGTVASSPHSYQSVVDAQVMTGTLVIVARTFVPSLPDELSIQTGEQVRVITKFDDGWAHVERTKSGSYSENGVVPVECLEPVTQRYSPPPGMLLQEAVESWRLSKRKSSLVTAGPAVY